MKERRFKLNGISSLILQVISVVCGIVIPQLLIKRYGSEAYGAMTSATQFLAYITIMEGGIGAVARAALYKPLAENDSVTINNILNEFKRFYIKLTGWFIIYTIILACAFYYISNSTSLTWEFCFGIVCVMSVATIIEYCFGVTAGVLLQSDQRLYVTNVISCITKVLNVIIIFLLVYMKAGLICVELAASLAYIVKVIFLNRYVRQHYTIDHRLVDNESRLKQKKEAFGQHIAYFIHNKTDIVVLTIFSGLQDVAVYSVYNYVAGSILNIIKATTSGMEGLFGEFYARKDINGLNSLFDKMEYFTHTVMVIFYSVTIVLFVPFVRIYTAGISDADYIRPELAVLMVVANIIYCIRQPYLLLVQVAGMFKETQVAAYMEAILNIVLSYMLVNKFGMEGVVFATAVSLGLRTVYFIVYIRRHILFRSIWACIKRCLVSVCSICGIYYITNSIFTITPDNYMEWCKYAVASVGIAVIVTAVFSMVFYKRETIWIVNKIMKKGDSHE